MKHCKVQSAKCLTNMSNRLCHSKSCILETMTLNPKLQMYTTNAYMCSLNETLIWVRRSHCQIFWDTTSWCIYEILNCCSKTLKLRHLGFKRVLPLRSVHKSRILRRFGRRRRRSIQTKHLPLIRNLSSSGTFSIITRWSHVHKPYCLQILHLHQLNPHKNQNKPQMVSSTQSSNRASCKQSICSIDTYNRHRMHICSTKHLL